MSTEIRKAVIPLAGLGTRMGPLARAVPKALLPLPGPTGDVRPVLHCICAEAAAAGGREVALVVSPEHHERIETYLDAARQAGSQNLPERICLLVQDEPRGFGDAVARARDFVADEPFLLLLGDTVYRAAAGKAPCAAQVARAFAERPGAAAMIGVQIVGSEALSRVGVVAGEPLAGGTYRCTAIAEKPELSAARTNLRTPGLDPDRFLAHGGIYAFSPEIFSCLADLSRRLTPPQELEMTDAQAELLSRRGEAYFLRLIEGESLDTGTPEVYRKAFAALL